MSTYIKNLINQGEHQQLDFKFEISDAQKIARTMSAFSNTDGGTLLVGVKDNGGVSGVSSDEEYYMIESAAQMYCKPEVSFDVKKWDVDGKTVLEVMIPKTPVGKPCFAKTPDGWRAFVRREDQNIMANRVLLEVWKQQKNKKGVFIKYTEKEKMLLNFLERNRSITMAKYCRIANINKQIAEKILINMVLVELLEMIITDKGVSYKLKEPNK